MRRLFQLMAEVRNSWDAARDDDADEADAGDDDAGEDDDDDDDDEDNNDDNEGADLEEIDLPAEDSDHEGQGETPKEEPTSADPKGRGEQLVPASSFEVDPSEDSQVLCPAALPNPACIRSKQSLQSLPSASSQTAFLALLDAQQGEYQGDGTEEEKRELAELMDQIRMLNTSTPSLGYLLAYCQSSGIRSYEKFKQALNLKHPRQKATSLPALASGDVPSTAAAAPAKPRTLDPAEAGVIDLRTFVQG